ncbi:MAG: MBL fold metallo-hydrolase [Bacteroidales bacterium]
MIITVLTENFPGSHTDAEHGLSYLIEHDGMKILFDSGQSDLFIRNALKIKRDIKDIDLIVLSHGHFDHGGGLEYLPGGKLICHPGCFLKRYRKRDHSYIGLKSSRDEFSRKFDLIATSEPYFITNKIIFEGEIPRVTNFESQTTPFVFEDGTPDFVMDDSALILLSDRGLFVVTGCGHAGIVNTLEHAKKVTGRNTLLGVMGGFHLKEFNRQTRETIHYLKENNVKYVYPSHCTGPIALSAFYKSFAMKQVVTGDIFEF